MKYYKSLEKTFDKYDFEAVSMDINMFNKDSILTDTIQPYIDDMEKMVIYVNDDIFTEVSTLTELYNELKGLGFGKDYEITWSLFNHKDKNGLEFNVIAVNVP